MNRFVHHIDSLAFALSKKVAPRLFKRWKEQKMKSFFSTWIKPGDLCFDIGASLGNYTEIFLSLGARVVAVEPVYYSVNYIRKRFTPVDEVVIVQKAVFSSSGKGEIFVSNRTEISSMSKGFIDFYGKNHGHQWESSQEVELTTLDALISVYGRPRFCKIDVEGLELEVFKGLHHVIPCLSFEFNYPFREQAVECIKLLVQGGFTKFNYSIFENFKWQLNHWVPGEELIQVMRTVPKQFLTGDIYATQ